MSTSTIDPQLVSLLKNMETNLSRQIARVEENLSGRVGLLEVAVETTNRNVRDLEAKVDRMESKVDRLEVNVDRLESKVDTLEVKVDRLETKVDTLEVKVNRLESKVDKLEAKVDRLDVKVERLESKVDTLEAKVDRLDVKVERLEAFSIRTDDGLERLEDKMAAQRSAIERVEGVFVDNQTTIQRYIKDVKDQVREDVLKLGRPLYDAIMKKLDVITGDVRYLKNREYSPCRCPIPSFSVKTSMAKLKPVDSPKANSTVSDDDSPRGSLGSSHTFGQ